MSDWLMYPDDYRQQEISQILRALKAGDSVHLIGLSGAGKSNLVGFLAHRWPFVSGDDDLSIYFLDCNTLPSPTVLALLKQICLKLGEDSIPEDGLIAASRLLGDLLEQEDKNVCLVFDRFEVVAQSDLLAVSNHLRSLRDRFKYRLTYLVSTRQPFDFENEMSELFYANTLWLGPLSRSDAEWSISRYASRRGDNWPEEVYETIIDLSGGYPSLLRGLCEAYEATGLLDVAMLTSHPSVQRRVREFWQDNPESDILTRAGLDQIELLVGKPESQNFAPDLTAKEHALLTYLQQHPNEICSKDELVEAVWPEDEIYESGIRDSSLAQLVRRLRVKIEPDPSNPIIIHTLPGRGYRYTPKE
ncbi:MAG: winged helix-turn-helix domain-containing protein [Anaerolineales bacterium]